MNVPGPHGQGQRPYSPYGSPAAPNIPPPPSRPIPPPPQRFPSGPGYPPNGSGGPYAPPPQVPRPPGPGGNRNVGVIVAVVVGVVVLLSALGVGGWFFWQQNVADDIASPSPATPQAVAGQANPSSAVPTRTAVPRASLPANAQTCPADFGPAGEYISSAVGTTITSCPFAEAVRVAYAGSGQPGVARTVNATSPVTGRSYAMNCSPVAGLVTCTGGENAVVYVY